MVLLLFLTWVMTSDQCVLEGLFYACSQDLEGSVTTRGTKQ